MTLDEDALSERIEQRRPHYRYAPLHLLTPALTIQPRSAQTECVAECPWLKPAKEDDAGRSGQEDDSVRFSALDRQAEREVVHAAWLQE